MFDLQFPRRKPKYPYNFIIKAVITDIRQEYLNVCGRRRLIKRRWRIELRVTYEIAEELRPGTKLAGILDYRYVRKNGGANTLRIKD